LQFTEVLFREQYVRLFISEKPNWLIINFLLQIDTAKIISDGATLFLLNRYVLYWPGFSASAVSSSAIHYTAISTCRMPSICFWLLWCQMFSLHLLGHLC
jgi:hypothetical protein